MGESVKTMGIRNLAFAVLVATAIHPSAQAREIDPDVVETCKDARDFQGCVNAFSSKEPTRSGRRTRAPSTNPEQCDDEGWCIANAGLDIFGLPKVVGWSYKSLDNGIHYRGPNSIKSSTKEARTGISPRNMFTTTIRTQSLPHPGITGQFALGRESVVTTPMAPTIATQQRQNASGSLDNQAKLEDHGFVITPGLGTALTTPMRTM